MKRPSKNSIFEKFAGVVTRATGSTAAFACALAVVLLWAVTGPFFDFSETWQLVINTATTIITFLMVFLIQKAQNKDSLAIQLKLNELVASSANASNRLVDVEDLTEQEMKTLQSYYCKLSNLTKNDDSLLQSHSIDEATELHVKKKKFKNTSAGDKNVNIKSAEKSKKKSATKKADKK